ncbi:hypothetical protein Anas_14708 [Armadillidium nasatum]|uniref:Uncharacterized protein n=1 Tax=Armadillidium nasatum TaxID=96803 RepID=A0A5N5T0I5_9CRUS|nr:hypothetical protein Anas_14708 [Armadillidium nasatum]
MGVQTLLPKELTNTTSSSRNLTMIVLYQILREIIFFASKSGKRSKGRF